MKTNNLVTLIAGGLAGLLCAQQATAANALERPRGIVSGGDK